ncbi:uncharacterized protein [Diabrotica undecimpunctata]|uniref:uncharacterized protein n=1 Tax=Diabrotica undecimpunctata TaxID=50387 RepID=UPI003B63B03D
MYKYLLFVSLIGLSTCFPGIIDSGHGLGGYGGGGSDWQGALANVGIGAGFDHSAGLDDGHGQGSPDGSIGGDFHHGVSVVSTGGGNKGAVFDLTNQGGGGHHGAFGGSFVASSKYSAGGHGGDGGSSGGFGGHGGYGVSEGTGFAEHYSDVLGASQPVAGYDGGHLGSGHEGLAALHSIGGGEGLGGYH